MNEHSTTFDPDNDSTDEMSGENVSNVPNGCSYSTPKTGSSSGPFPSMEIPHAPPTMIAPTMMALDFVPPENIAGAPLIPDNFTDDAHDDAQESDLFPCVSGQRVFVLPRYCARSPESTATSAFSWLLDNGAIQGGDDDKEANRDCTLVAEEPEESLPTSAVATKPEAPARRSSLDLCDSKAKTYGALAA